MAGTWPLLIVITLILTLTKYFASNKKTNKNTNLPPSPSKPLPILGHLHLLKQPVHHAINSLSQICGPIMLLRFGPKPVVFISSPSAIEECFTKNDIVLANRPVFSVGKYIFYDNKILVMCNYGDHWRNLRRIISTEMLSPSKLKSFSHIREDEVRVLLTRLRNICLEGRFREIELRPLFLELSANIVTRMMVGKKYCVYPDRGTNAKANLLREVYREINEANGELRLSDFVGFLGWIDYGFRKKLVKLGKRIDMLLQEVVDDVRADKDNGGGDEAVVVNLLALQESQPELYTDELIKGLIMVALLAGIETTALTLEWAFCCVLNDLEILEKANGELRTKIGDNRLVCDSDLQDVPYIEQIVSETTRLHPVFPWLVSHVPSSDCTIRGYQIPAGTMVFINAWGVHRDPNLWDQPTRFKPERFDKGIKDEMFKFLPFGVGRRACPGKGLAGKVICLILASLLQCFEWRRVGDDQIDTTEKHGASLSKAEPLHLLCKAHPNLSKLLS